MEQRPSNGALEMWPGAVAKPLAETTDESTASVANPDEQATTEVSRVSGRAVESHWWRWRASRLHWPLVWEDEVGGTK